MDSISPIRGALAFAALLGLTLPVAAQFGGDGRDGVFKPTTNQSLAGGTYQFKSVHIPKGVTVRGIGDKPLQIYSQGPVTIEGTLDVSGYGPVGRAGGLPGPGGWKGGKARSSYYDPKQNPFGYFGYAGEGPGRGSGGYVDYYGRPTIAHGRDARHLGTYGSQFPFTLLGGSGGGGDTTARGATVYGGGGGGGAVMISSDGLVGIFGVIRADGGGGIAGSASGSGGSVFVRGMGGVIVKKVGTVSAVPHGNIHLFTYRAKTVVFGTVSPAPSVVPAPQLLVEAKTATANKSLYKKLPGGLNSTRFGESMAIIGDVDGDKYPDAAIGVPGDYYSTGRVEFWSLHKGKFLSSIPGIVGRGALGTRVAAVGDVDADGVPDVLASTASIATTRKQPCIVRVISGKTGKFLWSFSKSEDKSWFGDAIAGPGDLNGDGYADILVGAPREQSDKGVVRLYSGKDGKELHKWVGEFRFGTRIVGTGDIDADKVPDFAVMDWNISNRGRIQFFSGKTYKLIHKVEGKLADDKLGERMAMLGDLDGDSVADLGACGHVSNTIQVISGRTGKVILDLRSARRFHHSIAAAGDLDHDGTPDILYGSNWDNSRFEKSGTVEILSGKTGKPIRTLFGAAKGQEFGSFVLGGVDVTGDKQPDLVIASDPTVKDGDFVEVYHGGVIDPLADLTFTVSGLPGGSVQLFGSLGTADIWIPGIGSVLIDPATVFPVIAVQLPLAGLEPHDKITLPVPDHAAIRGRTFYFQGLHLAPPAWKARGDGLTNRQDYEAKKL